MSEATPINRSRIDQGDAESSPAQRHVCARCGCHLWLWDPRWPRPAIDTPLPVPPQRTHLLDAHR